MATDLKLNKYIAISGVLRCRTGTRIGGSKEDLEIGGLDNPIIRDPVDKMPYIPGSSLKGKLRSLLEYKYDRVGWTSKQGRVVQNRASGEPCGCAQELSVCPVCTIFGPHKVSKHDLGPSRIIVRDAVLSDESRADLAKLLEEGLQYSEVKTENMINRKTGVAENPRAVERVPKGTKFILNISVRIFKGDDEAKIKAYIKEAVTMLEQDYLGGSGTRGYGWVAVENLTIDGEKA
ncbi:MAG: type III-A CRISPR-associated RAMP protein Csm3 [Dehalococcoidia bacterium]|nr:type III-A CRISPR-associated RAMP protein Csm3 [Dehalococcoidia bacterium]